MKSIEIKELSHYLGIPEEKVFNLSSLGIDELNRKISLLKEEWRISRDKHIIKKIWRYSWIRRNLIGLDIAWKEDKANNPDLLISSLNRKNGTYYFLDPRSFELIDEMKKK